jgi:hypothetical protein
MAFTESRRFPQVLKAKHRSGSSQTITSFTEDPEYSDPDDLDDGDQLPGFCLSPVSDVILRTAVQEERQFSLSCDQFRKVQTQMLPKYRESAVKWLLQLNSRFKFSSDALYSAVMYFDLVSMALPIPKSEIQVYAAVCYCLAIKVDVRRRPTINELNQTSGESFTAGQFAEREMLIVETLSFKLSYPTTKFHTRIYLDLFACDARLVELANFFAEITLLKFEFLDFPPSIAAIAVIVVAAGSIGMERLAAEAVRVSHCAPIDRLLACIEVLIVHGTRVVQGWKRPTSAEVLELLARVNFGVDFKAIVTRVK